MKRQQEDYWLIKEWAQEFRNGLEYIRNNRLYGSLRMFANFPDDCCGYTSDLLAQYLLEKGIDRLRIQFVRSISDINDYTHCWLMIDEEYFLDITADQFNGKKYFKKYGTIEECILVERNSGFYEVFEKNNEFLRDFGIDSRSNMYELETIYEETLTYIA